jgi:hypothetical protein
MLKIKPLYLVVLLLFTVGITWVISAQYFLRKQKNTSLTIANLDTSLSTSNEILRGANKNILIDWQLKIRSPMYSFIPPAASQKFKAANDLAIAVDRLIGQVKDNVREGMAQVLQKATLHALRDSMTIFAKNLTGLLDIHAKDWLTRLPVEELLQNRVGSDLGLSNNMHEIPSNTLIANLTNFQNIVLRSSNIVLNYFNYTYAGCGMGIQHESSFDVLVQQNAESFLQGQTLKIRAGIGSFVVPINTTIKIAGTQVLPDENGIASYETKVFNKKGFVPVSISFTNPSNGQLVIKNVEIRYDVVKP